MFNPQLLELIIITGPMQDRNSPPTANSLRRIIISPFGNHMLASLGFLNFLYASFFHTKMPAYPIVDWTVYRVPGIIFGGLSEFFHCFLVIFYIVSAQDCTRCEWRGLPISCHLFDIMEAL